MLVTIYIILRDRNIYFCAGCFVIVMFVGALWALQNVNDVFDRLTLTDATNPNVLGHNCVCALMLLMLFIKPKKKIYNILILGCACVLGIVVIYSGSRMAFICLCAFLILFFLRILPSYSDMKRSNIILRGVFSILLMIILVYITLPFYRNTLKSQEH